MPDNIPENILPPADSPTAKTKQVAQLSQRDRAAGWDGGLVMAKRVRLELEDNILRTYLQPLVT